MGISVVIPTFNGASVLRRCLNSLARQTVGARQIVVVDNGSSDETRLILDHIDLPIKCIFLNKNLGFSRAVNIGLQATSEDFLLVLNNDVVLDELSLETLGQAADSSSYGSYAPLIYDLAEPRRLQSGGLMFSTAGYGNRSNADLFTAAITRHEIFCPSGACALYRRAALEDVGLFNEDFFMFFEDLELGFRLQLRGWRSLLVPQSIGYHVGGWTANRFFSEKVRESVANSAATLLTCVPKDWFSLDWPTMLRFYVWFYLQMIRHNHSRDMVRGLRKACVRLPALWRRRRLIQSSAQFDGYYLRSLLYNGPISINFQEGAAILRQPRASATK